MIVDLNVDLIADLVGMMSNLLILLEILVIMIFQVILLRLLFQAQNLILKIDPDPEDTILHKWLNMMNLSSGTFSFISSRELPSVIPGQSASALIS